MMSKQRIAHFSPGRILFFSVLLTIGLGTLALSLPVARNIPMSLFDLFFTACSATCVTGLQTVPIENFTHFGHIIILILIQIGGLGLITLTIFLFSLFVEFGLATQLMAVRLLELESWKNIKRLLFYIIGITLSLELIGTLLLYPIMRDTYASSHAWFHALFHAISSFCNAGITLFENGMETFSHNPIMLLITASLMFFGGIGFVTWYESTQYIRTFNQKKRYPMSLHSRVILYVSALLIIGATLLFLVIEHNHTLIDANPFLATVHSLFYAISFRGGGFLINSLATFSSGTLLLILLLGFIGAAPGSTGSGIKLSTLAILGATVKSAITGRSSVEMFGRRIAFDQVYRTIAIVTLSAGWVLFTTFILLLTDGNQTFFSLLLESLSAFATLGISTGITPNLSYMAKTLLIVSMIIGRVGSLTLILTLKEFRETKKPEKGDFQYPEERVILS